MELLKNQFFACFGETGAQSLAQRATPSSFEANEIIFEESHPSDCIYLVEEGSVELTKSSGSKWVRIAVAQDGDYFGELGVIDGSARSARATAVTRVQASKIPRAPLMEVLHMEPPRAALQLFERVLDQLRATNNRYVAETVRKEKMHFIGEMAGAIIHDFRNPIAAIQLAAELVSDKDKDPTTQKRCDLIVKQSQRMVLMVQELLDFARGNPVLKLESLSIASLFEQFATLNQDFFEQSGVRVTIQPIATKVELDTHRMLRVLQNLVQNAIDALNGKGEVEISARENGRDVEICVRDTGPGIPESIRETFFDPFVTHGKANGTGLGMSIVQMIVDAHKGKISFTTETAKGTSFLIRLPKAH